MPDLLDQLPNGSTATPLGAHPSMDPTQIYGTDPVFVGQRAYMAACMLHTWSMRNGTCLWKSEFEGSHYSPIVLDISSETLPGDLVVFFGSSSPDVAVCMWDDGNESFAFVTELDRSASHCVWANEQIEAERHLCSAFQFALGIDEQR